MAKSTIYILQIFCLLCFIRCGSSNQGIKYYPITGDTVDALIEEYSSDGALTRSYHLKNDLLHGQEKIYHPNGNVKTSGNWLMGNKKGWFRYYSSDKRLECMRQYISVNDTANWNKNTHYLNQVIQFNENGDTILNGSFFFRLFTTADTIISGNSYGFRIQLVPLFKNAHLVLCDFDQYYNQKPGTICDTFLMEKNEISLSPREYHLGLNTIRCKILNFEDYYDSSLNKTKQRFATIYITDKFFVKAN